jgi:hypothetical protein
MALFGKWKSSDVMNHVQEDRYPQKGTKAAHKEILSFFLVMIIGVSIIGYIVHLMNLAHVADEKLYAEKNAWWLLASAPCKTAVRLVVPSGGKPFPWTDVEGFGPRHAPDVHLTDDQLTKIALYSQSMKFEDGQRYRVRCDFDPKTKLVLNIMLAEPQTAD